jgi:histone-lysine N-methyltransferase SETD8
LYISGKGVFALRDFSKGEFLLEYDGELLSYKEGARRMKEYDENIGSFIYLFTFKDKKFW